MGTTTGITAGGSEQNNNTSTGNTEREYFPYFDTIGTNPFRGFGTFENNNGSPSRNNNNNNPPLPLLSPGFEGELGGEFNPPLRRNAEGLDLNVTVLVNALTEVNLRINHVERESNHIKPIEFGGTEVEDLNK